jgi:hypothetical protein
MSIMVLFQAKRELCTRMHDIQCCLCTFMTFITTNTNLNSKLGTSKLIVNLE